MNVGTITATIAFGSVNPVPTVTDNAKRHLLERLAIDPAKHWNGSPCWLWTGTTSNDGYGVLGPKWIVEAVCKGTHRASKIVFDGWVPTSSREQIRHQCHNRACFNPAHALTGSAFENYLDRLASPDYGRVLSDDDIRTIRKLRVKEPYRPRPRIYRIAEHYGVHRSTIDRILSGRLWGHVV